MAGYAKIAPLGNTEFALSKANFGKINDAVYDLKKLRVDVRDYGTGVGTGNEVIDTAAADAAQNDVYLAGGGAVIYPRANYKIARRVSGQQKLGGIWVRKGVSHIGIGATLTLADNCDFITFRDPTTATVGTITANVAVGAVQYTVGSTSGFAVGDDVGVRLGDNAWDSAETAFFMFAKVLTVDSSTLITLDRTTPVAMTVASTAAGNRKITKLDEVVENVVIDGFELINPQTGGANAEFGVWAQYARNCVVANIVGEHPGAALLQFSYCDTCQGRNLRLRKCSKQAAQASKGRVIGTWNSYNCEFDGVYGENFENQFLFNESYTRGTRLRNIHAVNNNAARTQSTTAIFFNGQSSEFYAEDVTVEGKGGTLLVDGGGTTGNIQTFNNLTLRTDSELVSVVPSQVAGTFRVNMPAAITGDYLEVKRFSKAFRLTASMSDLNIPLPSGIYRRVKVYVSTKTGLTFFYFIGGGNVDVLSTLVAAQLVDLSGTAVGGLGTNYPFNDAHAKRLGLYSDGTVPAGAYGTIEIEYYPIPGDDLGGAFIQDTSRLIRGLDVIATNALVAKTKAGVPADGDFTPPPPDGTIAIDTTNLQIYVRMGGVWKKTVALT